jgi:hypothetical protein
MTPDQRKAIRSLVRAERAGQSARGYIRQGFDREARAMMVMQLNYIDDAKAQLLGYDDAEDAGHAL